MENESKTEKRKQTSFPIYIILLIIINACFFPIVVSGSSMENTLFHQDFGVSSRLSYMIQEPEYGDIVVASNPLDYDEDNYVIKRIIGVPGDELTILPDKIIRNGSILTEDYATYQNISKVYEYIDKTVSLKEDEYYVVGDNRNNSYDSRIYGAVSKDFIKGKVLFINNKAFLFYAIIIFSIIIIPDIIFNSKKEREDNDES